jgi:TPR repeat protein/serine/threonine protein kinase
MGSMLEKLSAPSAEGAVQKVRFGNFEVINDPDGRPLLLGKGTFGRTYQARHCYLDTIVALKIITERYVADAAVRRRFLTEARAVAKLSHPHIARLYDFGEMNGVLHYAMEYCGGGSLADFAAQKGAVPLRQTIEIAQQISGALKCAHTAGFIHRDLKPSNIMLSAPDGPMFAKLIDFGLVQPSLPGATRSFGDDQSVDGARFLGTPLFASPEQLREEPMDVRTDLFSLGMTLWFLMAGRAPESGSSAEIAASRLNRESYAARLPANLPPQFRDVLAQLLEKDRKNRFATAADVFKALNACAAALGFRRARDYTDPAATLEWEDAEATESGAPDFTKIEPAEVESVEAELSSQFNVVARINEDFTGLNYVAEEVGKKGATSILHVLNPLLLEDGPALERFRVHIAQLLRLDVTEIVRPKAIKRYSDYVAVISDKPGGTDLLSVLRTERTVPLVEAALLLEKIADVCDQLCAAGLPGAQLAPGRIFVESANDGLSKAQPWLFPRFLAVSEATELARMNESEDASSTTMTTDMLGDPARADNMAEHFASLLYRVVAGRNCPVAASLSSQAYVAIPGLSEQSNRILALVIARQVEDSSCGKVLREILNTEGIVPRVAGHSSAGCTVRPGSSTVSPLTPPPVTPVDRAPAAPPRSATSLGKRTKRNSLVAIGAAVAFILFVGLSLFVRRRQPPVEKTKGTQPTTVAISPAGQKDYNSAIEYIAGLNKVQINEPKALELLQRAVAHHFPEAEARLAAWTMFGVNGARKDSAKASALAQQSLSDGLETAAGSRATAQYELASLYRQGLGVEKDASKAAPWYQKAANQGLAAAQNNLGVLYQNGNGVEKDLTKAAELYRKAADQGFAGAQNNLGVLYQNGNGVEKDLTKAAELYQKAADQGFAGAQNNLGISYQNGNGVEKDLTKAAELYQKAADQGEARAQTNLGWLFENGNGVPKDFNKAAQLYQKAADQGFAGAQSNLGILYQNGNGVEKDLTKAAELCQKAADQGEARAQTNLGSLFENGNGVPKDFNKAAQLYQKAADQGFAPAQNNLGALYQNGNGVEKDLTKAAELYQKAADQWEPYAQKNLGGLYEYGMGVAKDVNKAAELYQKSADQGNQAARDSLRRLGQH